jgi:hypothetical protein
LPVEVPPRTGLLAVSVDVAIKEWLQVAHDGLGALAFFKGVEDRPGPISANDACASELCAIAKKPFVVSK